MAIFLSSIQGFPFHHHFLSTTKFTIFPVAAFAISADALVLKVNCYEKIVGCCFKYAACGYVPKTIYPVNLWL